MTKKAPAKKAIVKASELPDGRKKKTYKHPKRHAPQSKRVAAKVERRLIEAELDPSVERTGTRAGTSTTQALRLLAMSIYVTDVQGLTIRDLHKDPRLNHLSVTTLQNWSVADGWNAIRTRAVQSIRDHLVEQMQANLAQNLAREVQDLFNLRKMTIHHLNHTPPDKFETVGKLLLDTNKRLADIAELFQEGVIDSVGRPVPADQRAQGGRAMAHGFNPAELRQAARSVTGKQRAAMRARLARTESVNERKRNLPPAVGEARGGAGHGGAEHPEGRVPGED